MDIASAIICLALNVYHEARGESKKGQQAVALVTMNRVKSKSFPNDPCSVVLLHEKQFSWVEDKPLAPIEERSWAMSLRVASDVFYGRVRDFTGGALYFNTKAMGVRWKTSVEPLYIDNHVIY